MFEYPIRYILFIISSIMNIYYLFNGIFLILLIKYYFISSYNAILNPLFIYDISYDINN